MTSRRRVIASAALALVVAAAGLACGGSRTNERRLLPSPEAGPDIQEACALTARRCTRCHDLDRILVAAPRRPIQWRITVDDMRLLPSSGVTAAEADRIVGCLVYRSFGPQGLVELAMEVRP